MRYVEFRDLIRDELRATRSGLTWAELRDRLGLPYQHACPEWTRRLEEEIGLVRSPGLTRAYIWSVPPFHHKRNGSRAEEK
jgi:hypothetical protein